MPIIGFWLTQRAGGWRSATRRKQSGRCAPRAYRRERSSDSGISSSSASGDSPSGGDASGGGYGSSPHGKPAVAAAPYGPRRRTGQQRRRKPARRSNHPARQRKTVVFASNGLLVGRCK